LDSRDHQKFFGSATKASQLKTSKPQVLLHMGEQHFDLAP
jgi:hypothetical protein